MTKHDLCFVSFRYFSLFCSICEFLASSLLPNHLTGQPLGRNRSSSFCKWFTSQKPAKNRTLHTDFLILERRGGGLPCGSAQFECRYYEVAFDGLHNSRCYASNRPRDLPVEYGLFSCAPQVDLSCPTDSKAYRDWLLACNCNWSPRAY